MDLAAEDSETHLICRNLKRCRKCDQIKDRDKDFNRGGGPWYGVNGTCKACWRVRNRGMFAEKYKSDPEFRESHRARVKEYQVLGPKTGVRRGPQNKPCPLFRECQTCHTTKPISDFTTHRGTRRHRRCKSCWYPHQRELTRASYQKNPTMKARKLEWARRQQRDRRESRRRLVA